MDAISFCVSGKKDALILDFFAGSGTTLNAVCLLNYEDGGNRRCIIITNNEVSLDDSRKLVRDGYTQENNEWQEKGICKAVTWPRAKNTTLGKKSNGSLLSGDYITSIQDFREKIRKITQISGIDPEMMAKTKCMQGIVSLLGNSKLPKSLVEKDSKFVISEKYPASILFDIAHFDFWLEKLVEFDNVVELFIVTSDVRIFNSLKKRVQESLERKIEEVYLKLPMSTGFKANIEYFKIEFLEKDRGTLGQQFGEILPLLWLKAGSIGRRPKIDTNVLPEMMVLPENNLAILVDESKFLLFLKELKVNNSIKYVYLVTNSEEAFREMSSQLSVRNCYQLYRD